MDSSMIHDVIVWFWWSFCFHGALLLLIYGVIRGLDLLFHTS